MASSSPSPYSRLSIERRPKLLKDFLDQDDPYSCNSSRMIINSPNHKASSSSSRILLSRSRSRRAATATISAINKVINIVKFLPFVKSPSRTENSKKHNNIDHQDYDDDDDVSVVTVKVKDILRWKSFRDLADEKSTPLDFSFSPCRCNTTTAAATTTTATTGTSSERSSWCDSDFTAEDLPSWCGENDELEGVGGYDMRTKRATKLDHKDELCFDENEQHSPVSILESPFHEDNEEGYAFSFHRSLDDLDKRKSMLMQRIQHFESLADEDQTLVHEHDQEVEEIESKAEQLLSHLKETNTSLFMEECDEASEILFDFFRQELNTITTNIDIEKLMSEANSWISGENNGEFEWDMEDKRGNYIRDMERVVSWTNFEDEKQDLIMELEFEVFNDLVHEVLDDVLFS